MKRRNIFAIFAVASGVALTVLLFHSWIELGWTSVAHARGNSGVPVESRGAGAGAPIKKSRPLEETAAAAAAPRVGANGVSPFELGVDQLYCLLKRKAPGIEMSGQLRIAHTVINDGDKNFGLIVQVASSRCPRDSYSLIHISLQGEVDRIVDCRKASLAEVVLEFGRQWNIEDAPRTPGEENFAISGVGYFVKNCGAAGFMITRDGRFHYDERGILVDGGGCELWSTPEVERPFGGPIHRDDGAFVLDEAPCQENGRCVSVIDPVAHGIGNYEYVDDRNLKGPADTGWQQPIASRVFHDAFEDLDDPLRGPTGWEKPESWPALSSEPVCPFEDLRIDWSAKRSL